MIRCLIVVALLFGCTKQVYVPQIQTRITTDTITRIEPDSALLRAFLECDSLGEVRIKEIEQYKGTDANQQMEFAGGELKVETRWRTQYIERVREITDTITLIKEIEVVKRESYVPKVFWYAMGVAIAGIAYLALRIFKAVQW